MNRREFLGGAAAFGCFSGTAFGATKRPTVVGILTDTHVRPDKRTANNTFLAYRLFREKGVETIVHCGDLAHRWSEEAYRHYTDARAKAYDGATRPPEWHSFGHHDLIDFETKGLSNCAEKAPRCWAALGQRIGFSHPRHASFTCGGYTFLVFPQAPDIPTMDRMLGEACRANPGKPVFVVEHIPPFNAGALTCRYDDFEQKTRAVFEKYPQTVILYGHVHSSIRDDRCVWQDEFTAVNCGCLVGFACDYSGHVFRNESNESVLTLELEDDRFTFRRWDVKDGSVAGDPWVFVRTKAGAGNVPYRLLPAAPKVLPSYPAGARVTGEVQPSGDMKVTFPEILREGSWTYRHRIELFAEGTPEAFACVDEPGPWFMRPNARAKTRTVLLPAGLFDVGCEMIVRVTPEDFTGRFGVPIETRCRVEKTAWCEVWRGNATGKPYKGYGGGVEYALPNDLPVRGKVVSVDFEFSGAADGLLSLLDAKSRAPLAPILWARGDGTFRRFCLRTEKPFADDILAIWSYFSIAKNPQIRNIRVCVRD